MTQIPASGDISDNAVTEGDQKDNLEALRDVLFQDRFDPESLEVLAASVTPTQSWLIVEPEGGIDGDHLSTIVPTNVTDGQMILLSPDATAAARLIVDNAGNIITLGAVDIDLNSDNDAMLLIYDGANWLHMYTYRESPSDSRDDLGLGSVATLDNGAGNGIDADLLDGKEGALYQLAADASTNALSLIGIAGINYARKDNPVEQTFAGAVRTLGGILRVRHDASTPAITLEDNVNTKRGEFEYNATEIVHSLWEADGTTLSASTRSAPDTHPEVWRKSDAVWRPVSIIGTPDYNDNLMKRADVTRHLRDDDINIVNLSTPEIHQITLTAEAGDTWDEIMSWHLLADIPDTPFLKADLTLITPWYEDGGRARWFIKYLVSLDGGAGGPISGAINVRLQYDRIG